MNRRALPKLPPEVRHTYRPASRLGSSAQAMRCASARAAAEAELFERIRGDSWREGRR